MAWLVAVQSKSSCTIMTGRLPRLNVLVLVLEDRACGECVQLNVYPGLKGLKELLGHVPSWVSYEEKERVEVSAVATRVIRLMAGHSCGTLQAPC